MRYGLVSRRQADEDYGVVLTTDNQPDPAATAKRREGLRRERGPAPQFDFGYVPPARQPVE